MRTTFDKGIRSTARSTTSSGRMRTTYQQGHPRHGEVNHFQGNKHVRTTFQEGCPRHGEVGHLDERREHVRTTYIKGHPYHGHVDHFEGDDQSRHICQGTSEARRGAPLCVRTTRAHHLREGHPCHGEVYHFDDDGKYATRETDTPDAASWTTMSRASTCAPRSLWAIRAMANVPPRRPRQPRAHHVREGARTAAQWIISARRRGTHHVRRMGPRHGQVATIPRTASTRASPSRRPQRRGEVHHFERDGGGERARITFEEGHERHGQVHHYERAGARSRRASRLRGATRRHGQVHHYEGDEVVHHIRRGILGFPQGTTTTETRWCASRTRRGMHGTERCTTTSGTSAARRRASRLRSGTRGTRCSTTGRRGVSGAFDV